MEIQEQEMIKFNGLPTTETQPSEISSRRPSWPTLLGSGILVLIAMLGAPQPSIASGFPFVIDLEGFVTINPIPPWNLTDNGRTYNIVTGGSSLTPPFKDMSNGQNSSHGLTFQINSATNSQSQRTEYELARGTTNFPLNTTRYMSFYIKLDNNFPLPTNFVTPFQVFQGGGCSPPVTFNLENRNGQLRYAVNVRNTSNNGCPPNNPPIRLVSDKPIAKNTWHRFDFVVRLNSQQQGLCQVFHNGTLVGSLSNADVGFPSGWNGALNFGVAKFGLYRGSQSNSMKLTFDNVKFGSDISILK